MIISHCYNMVLWWYIIKDKVYDRCHIDNEWGQYIGFVLCLSFNSMFWVELVFTEVNIICLLALIPQWHIDSYCFSWAAITFFIIRLKLN